MSAAVVQLAAERPTAKQAAEILRDMAAMAERGDIVAVTVVYENRDGGIQNWQSGATSVNKMAGALLDAAIRRLGYVEG